MKNLLGTRRVFSLLLTLVLICLPVSAFAEEWDCPACGNRASGNYCNNCGRKYTDPHLSVFYDLALTEAQRLTEMCAVDELAMMYTQDAEVRATVRYLANFNAVVSSPERALIAYVSNEELIKSLPVIASLADLDDNVVKTVEALFRYGRGNLPSLLASYMNSSVGVNWMLATSIASIGDLTVVENTEEGHVLVLLDYSSEVPEKILVNIYVSPSGAASVSATFIKDIGFVDQLFQIADSSVGVQTLLNSLGLSADELDAVGKLFDCIQFQSFVN